MLYWVKYPGNSLWERSLSNTLIGSSSSFWPHSESQNFCPRKIEKYKMIIIHAVHQVDIFHCVVEILLSLGVIPYEMTMIKWINNIHRATSWKKQSNTFTSLYSFLCYSSNIAKPLKVFASPYFTCKGSRYYLPVVDCWWDVTVFYYSNR